MKTKIGVLGSCVSRDAFNSKFVPNYKDFFEVNISAQRNSLISIMQDPISFDEELIEINPSNPFDRARTYFISYDLNKSFLKELVENEINYLIMDNYLEIRMGILYFNDNIITNNDWDLPDTQFYKKINDKLILKMTEYPDEYFCIWTKYCDLFFNFLKINCPDVKVILNKSRQVDKVQKANKTTYINHDFSFNASIINPLLDKLDSYIINNYDVHVLDFDYENTFVDENHLWGIGPVHYSKNHYYSLIEDIKNIIHDDNLKKEASQSKNKFFYEEELLSKSTLTKNLKRANFETRVLLKNIKCKNINDALKFYNRARIDIKNFGQRNNKIEIIEYDANNSKVASPNWFKSNEGEGVIIENEKGFLDLKIRCIHDGTLKIYLRGPDIYDKNHNRFPVYIDYTYFRINDSLIFNNDNILVWHNQPYLFKKEVKNSEIINIHLKWSPFNSSCIFKK